MDTRRLHNSDMKKLVRILRDVPVPAEERHERKETLYRKYTKEDIQRLPSRLRSSLLSLGPTNLCSTHKGLNQNLLNDIWGWIRHEFDGAIGKFFYPLVMSHGLLTAEQKSKIRQLEPVLQMWQPNFRLEASAPPGHEPVRCGSKWHYQQDQCPACMMARIGSDVDILFALFAGMVGRFNSKAFTTMDALRSVAGWDSMTSKRLRFVRYWLRKTGGEDTLFQAGDLGMHLKSLRAQWKREQGRHLRSLARTSTQETPVRTMSSHNERPLTVADGYRQHSLGGSATTKTTGSWRAQELTAPRLFDPKLGPNPRPPYAKRLSPAENLGFEMPSMRERTYTVPYDQQDIHPALRKQCEPIPIYSPANVSSSNESRGSYGPDPTLNPDDSMSVVTIRLPQHNSMEKRPAPLHANHSPVPELQVPGSHRRENSLLTPAPSMISRRSLTTTHTIASYNGGPSSRANYVDPLDNSIYNYIETQEERVEKYRQLLATGPNYDPFADYDEDNASIFPTPQHQSMYSAFGDVAFNGARFDAIAEEEIEEWEKDELEEDDEMAHKREVDGGMTLGKGRYRSSSDASVYSNDVY
jgi:hypothetical protein